MNIVTKRGGKLMLIDRLGRVVYCPPDFIQHVNRTALRALAETPLATSTTSCATRHRSGETGRSNETALENKVMSPYPLSREGWPCIFLHPSEFAAADKAGYVDREPDRMVLRHPDFNAVILILRPIT